MGLLAHRPQLDGREVKNEPKQPILDDVLSQYENVRIGHMFGYPAYYVGQSMFACLYEGKVGLKLLEETANEARTKLGMSDFQPYGKPKMREWIQFDFESEEGLRRWMDLIDAAIWYAETRRKEK